MPRYGHRHCSGSGRTSVVSCRQGYLVGSLGIKVVTRILFRRRGAVAKVPAPAHHAPVVGTLIGKAAIQAGAADGERSDWRFVGGRRHGHEVSNARCRAPIVGGGELHVVGSRCCERVAGTLAGRGRAVIEVPAPAADVPVLIAAAIGKPAGQIGAAARERRLRRSVGRRRSTAAVQRSRAAVGERGARSRLPDSPCCCERALSRESVWKTKLPWSGPTRIISVRDVPPHSGCLSSG